MATAEDNLIKHLELAVRQMKLLADTLKPRRLGRIMTLVEEIEDFVHDGIWQF